MMRRGDLEGLRGVPRRGQHPGLVAERGGFLRAGEEQRRDGRHLGERETGDLGRIELQFLLQERPGDEVKVEDPADRHDARDAGGKAGMCPERGEREVRAGRMANRQEVVMLVERAQNGQQPRGHVRHDLGHARPGHKPVFDIAHDRPQRCERGQREAVILGPQGAPVASVDHHGHDRPDTLSGRRFDPLPRRGAILLPSDRQRLLRHNPIPPGALHVTVAGAGVMHEETVTRSGRSATGLQIWMDHEAENREVAPRGIHLAAADVPTVSADGVTRRVLIGASGGVASPVDAPVTATLVDVNLAPGAVFREEVPEGEAGFAIVRSGHVETSDGVAGPGSAAFAANRRLTLTAHDEACLTFLGGRALRQPFLPAGPFVASDEAQARAFRVRFGAGGMGRLTPFDQAALNHEFDTSLHADGE